MLSTYELVTLFLALGTVAFLIVERKRFGKFPNRHCLLTSFSFLIFAWICTNLEELFYEDFFNVLEHSAHFASAVYLSLWCFSILKKPETLEL